MNKLFLIMLILMCVMIIFAARKIINLANKANLDKKVEQSVEDKVATIPNSQSVTRFADPTEFRAGFAGRV